MIPSSASGIKMFKKNKQTNKNDAGIFNRVESDCGKYKTLGQFNTKV